MVRLGGRIGPGSFAHKPRPDSKPGAGDDGLTPKGLQTELNSMPVASDQIPRREDGIELILGGRQIPLIILESRETLRDNLLGLNVEGPVVLLSSGY